MSKPFKEMLAEAASDEAFTISTYFLSTEFDKLTKKQIIELFDAHIVATARLFKEHEHWGEVIDKLQDDRRKRIERLNIVCGDLKTKDVLIDAQAASIEISNERMQKLRKERADLRARVEELEDEDLFLQMVD